MSETGLLTIEWDRPMQPFERYWKIKEYKVAVKDWSDLPEDELEERISFQKFRDPEGAIHIYSIIEALEIRTQQYDFDSEPLNFTWEMVSFDTYEIEIQIDFENPEAITGDPENFDSLSITFWGTKYFTSTAGKEVRYGTKL